MIKYLRLGVGILPHLLKASPWIGSYNRKRKKLDLKKRYDKTRRLINVAFDHFRTDIYIDGEENLKDGPYLIVANHQAVMDPVIMIKAFENPMSFVAKAELKKVPWFGKIISLLDSEFIERDNLRQEIKVIRHVGESLEQNEKSWVIFPEGTRTKDKDMNVQEFKAGAIKAAYTSKKSILPIAIFGTHRIINRKLHKKRYAVQLSILKPIEYEEFSKYSTTDFAPILHDIVSEQVKILKKRDEEFLKQKKYR